jgi:hypothetical protein
MILNVNATFPHAQTYVLKLHRDAAPQEGRIMGRLEHMASGHQYTFGSGEELLACLASAALADVIADDADASEGER